MRIKQRGFTIVELLIVIVVIAILAAISIVAYNGIQERAKMAKKEADMSSISRASVVGDTTRSTPLYLSNDTMNASQINDALDSLGLGGFKGSIVVDSGLPVNNDACRQSPMTKDKYCIAINGKDARVVYWNNKSKKWIMRQYTGGSYQESDIGTGDYPDAQVY